MGNVLGKIFKWLVYVCAAGVILLALLVGVARLLLPLVPEYQDDIRRWAATATGFDVEFENIGASWPFAGPELQFIDVTVSTQDTGEPVFTADKLSVGISLLSLIRDRKILLSRLGVEGSQIRMRCDADGNLLFQDRRLDRFLRLEPDPDKPLHLPDLLIELTGIKLAFTDDLRSGGAHAFDIEQLGLRLSDEQILIDGDVDLPPEFGGRITISTDFPTRLLRPGVHPAEKVNRRSVAPGEQEWRIYFAGEELQFREILAYVFNRDVPVREAHGDITLAAAFRDRSPQSISVDLDAADVVLRMDASRSERYEVLSGQLEWSRDGTDGWLLAATDISVERGGLFAPRSDFSVSVQPAAAGRTLAARASANFLRLQDLYPLVRIVASENLLTAVVPEDLRLPQDLYGDVKNLDFSLQRFVDGPDNFSAAFKFTDVGVVGLEAGHSIRGISGELTADQGGGRLQIAGRSTEVEWPALFVAPIDVQSFSGLLVWRVSDDVIHVMSDNVQLKLPFLEASTRFELDWPRNGDSPRIDLTATGSASDIHRVVSILPLKKFGPRVPGWLDRAVVGGRISHIDARLSGPLRKFPFKSGEGIFRIAIDVQDGVLDYAATWPRIDNIDARLVFDGVSLTSRRNSGRIGRIDFHDSDIRIADLHKGQLEIRAHQPVAVDAALNFLQHSPVARTTGPVLEKATGNGTANVDLQLVVPIKHRSDYELGIVIDTHDARLGMQGLDWGLTDIGGTLTIRNTRFYAKAMTATLLGEPVTLDLRPAADSSDLYGQFIRVTGRTPVKRWMQALSLPFVERVSGPADWNALVLIPRRRPEGVRPPVHIIVRSDLVGVESRLPDPLAKQPAEPRALEVDVAFPAVGQLEVTGGLRKELTWAFELESVDQSWRIARGAVHAGAAKAIVPADRGVELSGRLAFVRFDDWLGLAGAGESDTAGSGAGKPDWQKTWHKAELEIDRLSAFGLLFGDVRLEADQDAQNWLIALQGPDLAGQVKVPLTLDTGRPIEANMERLWLVDTESEADGKGGGSGPADPREIPPIEIAADDFVINKMHFGSLHTSIRTVTGGILIKPIRMQAPTFTIEGDGAWLVHPNDDTLRQSHLALSLNGTDIKAVLSALDYDPVIEGKSIAASADLTWLGGPSEDFLQRADGKFSLRMKDGSVLAVSPGSGRILGVLSLAALPRRLSLDFSDVFDDGLGFDTLKGDFTVDDGNAYTCNLGLEGSVADMGIVGRAGLEARDYDQLAVVRPHVSNLLAVGGAVVGGPVVGAAMLLFSQIFHKPLSTLGESYYRVTGSWDDPAIEQIHGSDLDVAPLRNCKAYLADAITESLKDSPAPGTNSELEEHRE